MHETCEVRLDKNNVICPDSRTCSATRDTNACIIRKSLGSVVWDDDLEKADAVWQSRCHHRKVMVLHARGGGGAVARNMNIVLGIQASP
jgi:hypothetical protein